MLTLEEITFQAGRDALADQEAVVAGVRQRTGTLLAAQALVASFLGGTAISTNGFHVWLAPWDLKFAETETSGWLAAAGFGYQALRAENAPKASRISRLSATLGVLMVCQTVLWLTALGVD